MTIFFKPGRGVRSSGGAPTEEPLTTERLKKAAGTDMRQKKKMQEKTRSAGESVCQIEVEGRGGGRGCRRLHRGGT